MSPLDWLDQVKWDDNGLVTAIAQDASSGRVLMVAWMNRQALLETASKGVGGLFFKVPQSALAQG